MNSKLKTNEFAYRSLYNDTVAEINKHGLHVRTRCMRMVGYYKFIEMYENSDTYWRQELSQYVKECGEVEWCRGSRPHYYSIKNRNFERKWERRSEVLK